jgi:hypothetical protein
MKKTSILILIFLCIISCKENHKENIKAKQNAIEELKYEELEKEIKQLDYLLSKYPKSGEEITIELSKEQQKIMNQDRAFIFSKDENIGYKYSIIKKVKFNMSGKESEINAKYKIYLEAKKNNADGIINYKIKFTPFYVTGELVKKK